MRYKRSDSFVLKEIAGDHILIARGEYAINFSSVVIFNETGVLLWNYLSEPHSVDDMARLLSERYEVSKEIAAADVEAFLSKMKPEAMLLEEDD